MIVTRSYVRKLEFRNLIGAFTFQYAAILLDQETSPDPFPGGRGLGTRLGGRGLGAIDRATHHVMKIFQALFKGHAYIIASL